MTLNPVKTVLLSTSVLILIGCAAINFLDPGQKPAFDLVLVPGGKFIMGDFQNRKDPDALPLHRVEIKDFYITRYEITYEQYDLFADRNGLPRPDDDGQERSDRAVVNITWDEAEAFCNCYGMRLPTEQEWEYAARSGGLEEIYPGTNNRFDLHDYIRHLDNSVNYSFYVGSKKPNGLGLHDMGGNAYEWIGAFYRQYPDSGAAPVWADLDNDNIRIIRGGSFRTGAVQNYKRAAMLVDQRSSMVGFRCVKLIRKLRP